MHTRSASRRRVSVRPSVRQTGVYVETAKDIVKLLSRPDIAASS